MKGLSKIQTLRLGLPIFTKKDIKVLLIFADNTSDSKFEKVGYQLNKTKVFRHNHTLYGVTFLHHALNFTFLLLFYSLLNHHFIISMPFLIYSFLNSPLICLLSFP